MGLLSVGSFPRQLHQTISPGGYSACLGVESGGRAGNRIKIMRYVKYFALLGALLLISVGSVKAQDDNGGYYADYGAYGPPPVCPYGYFSYYPYACAPYGYWGSSLLRRRRVYWSRPVVRMGLRP